MPRPSSENGFSIVEALVAAMIAGVVVTQFYDGLGIGLRLDAATQRRAGESLVAFSALDTIRAQAAAGRRILPGQRFSGEADGTRWHAMARDAADSLASPWLGPGTVSAIEITVGDGGGTPALTAYIAGVNR